MNIEQFQKARREIIAELLDNHNKFKRYSPSKAYQRLDILFFQIEKEAKLEVVEALQKENEELKKYARHTISCEHGYGTKEWKCSCGIDKLLNPPTGGK